MECSKCGKKLADSIKSVTGEVAAHDNSYLDISVICSCGAYLYTFIRIGSLTEEEDQEEELEEWDWEEIEGEHRLNFKYTYPATLLK